MNDLLELTVREMSDKLEAGDVSSVELTEACLKQIETTDQEIKSFLTVDKEGALKSAKEADKKRASGDSGRLLGIPLAHKDIFCTKGVRTTASSKMLENFVPPYDATVVEKLKKAGTVMIGKTNCDEFAMGTSGENSAYQVTKNPWDVSKVPGGSSSGAATSVAGLQVPLATATDTGGSIRLPAAFCGVTGWKPTYGRVSRFGIIAMSSSLDTVGMIAKSVEDVAITAEVMSGKDKYDATTPEREVPKYFDLLKEVDIKNITIGVAKEYFGDGVDKDVAEVVRLAIGKLEKAGAKIKEVSLPHTKYGVAAYYVICPSEVSANLARYDGLRFGVNAGGDDLLDMYMKSRAYLGHEVKRRIMIGTYALSSGYYEAYYNKAQKIRTKVIEDFNTVFADCDLLATPVSPTVAWGVSERADDPLALYMSDLLTIPANLAGVPGLSVPCGFVNDLPVGLQLLAPQFEESKLFAVGNVYQQITDWHRACCLKTKK